MVRKILLFIVGLLITLPQVALADSCGAPKPKHSAQANGYYVLVWEFEDTSGSQTCTTTDAFWGYIIQLKAVPDSTDPPDNDYDVYAYDPRSLDLLQGEGVNLQAAASTRGNIATPLTQEGAYVAMWGERITLTISSTGGSGSNTTKGTIIMLVKEF